MELTAPRNAKVRFPGAHYGGSRPQFPREGHRPWRTRKGTIPEKVPGLAIYAPRQDTSPASTTLPGGRAGVAWILGTSRRTRSCGSSASVCRIAIVRGGRAIAGYIRQEGPRSLTRAAPLRCIVSFDRPSVLMASARRCARLVSVPDCPTRELTSYGALWSAARGRQFSE